MVLMKVVVGEFQSFDGMLAALVPVGSVRMIARVGSTGMGVDLGLHWSIAEEIVAVVGGVTFQLLILPSRC